MFALVPSTLVKHDSLRNLEESCNFGNRTYLHRPLFLLTKTVIECVISAEEDMYPNIRVLLTIGCTLPVSSA
ncbi:unnamed protein product [Porites lobata]|uniref:Uncharacterized protein n=1 Tax=Porites lobata TaxID=104759 RepID=A0ABN8S036_9CNID|nr:unnamed protein product [Porites lobata]